MSMSQDLLKQLDEIATIESLTEVFESIASLRIRQIKDRVVSSKTFFTELWQIYAQLRIDPKDRLKSRTPSGRKKNKNAIIIITSAGGLSGEIDKKIIDRVLAEYDRQNDELIVIGTRGVVLLAEHKVKPVKVFDLPDITKSIDASPIIRLIEQYQRTTVYYQTFVSLAVQDVGKIELLLAAKQLGDEQSDLIHKNELVYTSDYLFEPSLEAVILYLESMMLGVALTQVILESRLAQFASRFTAMTVANTKAHEMYRDYNLKYHSAKRAERDEASHELIYNRSRL